LEDDKAQATSNETPHALLYPDRDNEEGSGVKMRGVSSSLNAKQIILNVLNRKEEKFAGTGFQIGKIGCYMLHDAWLEQKSANQM
jgi:hypothetical protein